MREDPTTASSSLRHELDLRLTAAMAKAQDGDRLAYDMVLRDSVPIIRRVARNQGATADFIDDAVQDVLITLHGSRQNFDPSRSFVAWLTTIAQHRTIDLLRSRGRRGAREVHSPTALEEHPADDNPEREAVRRSEAAGLRAEIAALPEGQREAVETLALNEIALEDASKSTGRTKTALKVNLHRAIATLRRRMLGQTDTGKGSPADEDRT